MYYIKTATDEFMETSIDIEKIATLSRDIKVFKLSNGKIIKTNNFTFYEIVKDVPEGAVSGEVLWDYKEKDVTDRILY
jgi:hypothetical protein